MEHLWKLKLCKCSYKTLRYEFISLFQTNEERAIARYIGRPSTIHMHSGIGVTRQNVGRGGVAQFRYSNEREMPARKGLAEILGYMTLKQDDHIIDQGSVRLTKKPQKCRSWCDNCTMKECPWIVTIHHERMSYYTEQVSLEPALINPEVDETSSSKDKMCVSTLQGILQGKECEKTVLEVVSRSSIEVEKKEEEVIESTHTCLTPKIIPQSIPSMPLRLEESAILNAKPLDSDPDRAKVSWAEEKTTVVKRRV